MFYSILPIVIILASLIGIVIIIVRKFPQLTVVEVEKIEEVKIAKKKEQIKLLKFQRSLKVLVDKIKKYAGHITFFKTRWEAVQAKFRIAVYGWQERYKKARLEEIKTKAAEQTEEKAQEAVQEVNTLLQMADDAYSRNDLSLAETRYIEVIKQEPYNVEAYRGLGKVYFDLKKYKEAIESFEFLLKLKPDDGKALNRLGMIAEEQNDWDGAVRYFEAAVKVDDSLAIRYFDLGRAYASLNKPALSLRNFAKAVNIEPNNPKYLDQLLEISLVSQDADLAKATFDRLRLVNPENQKLLEFQQRIRDLE